MLVGTNKQFTKPSTQYPKIKVYVFCLLKLTKAVLRTPNTLDNTRDSRHTRVSLEVDGLALALDPQTADPLEARAVLARAIEALPAELTPARVRTG